MSSKSRIKTLGVLPAKLTQRNKRNRDKIKLPEDPEKITVVFHILPIIFGEYFHCDISTKK